MQDYFPDIRWIKDIRVEHVQLYVDIHEKQWTTATMRLYQNNFRKLALMARSVYNADLDFSDITFITRQTGKVKTNPMSTDDFIRLMQSCIDSGGKFPWVPLLTATSGTRIEEVLSIKPEEVDLENGLVYLNNCKNGRKRIVTIAPEYLFIWKSVKEKALEHNRTTICEDMKLDSYNQFLLKRKKAAGIFAKYPMETNHCIRKMYAKRRFAEEQLKGFSPLESWSHVQVELGHGEKNRNDLFEVYIGQKYEDYLESFKQNHNLPVFDLNDLKKQVDYILSFKTSGGLHD